jgi:hypothetical protein
MKILFFTFIFFSVFSASAQVDTVRLVDSIPNDTIHYQYIDTIDHRLKTPQGNLFRDDHDYNLRYSVGGTLLRVTSANVFNWAFNRYLLNEEWTDISPETWKYNLKHGWEWDADRFGVNFIGHPHSGSVYFNAARSRGYSFWGSLPFAVAGSVQWEWFAENTRPSKNDLINTPLSGAFLGEIFYRVSSNILDDRSRGTERVFREILAGIVNPTRALNRLTQGKSFRVTPYEVYQKEPLNITFSAGMHRQNPGTQFWTGGTNAIVNLQLDYGIPFEKRKRRPFDVFRLRLESRYGADKRLIDNVLGYGLLTGKTVGSGNHGMLTGFFQQFDYWSNQSFELGSLGFGPGVISRLEFSKKSNLFSGLHISAVPLAGTKTRFAPDTSQIRDYPFGGGFQGRIEERLNIGNRVSLGFNGYYYWIYHYEKSKTKTRIGIIKPSIALRLFKNVSVGFEHHVYYDNQFLEEGTEFHTKRTEQKVYLQLFFEDKKRSGNYY